MAPNQVHHDPSNPVDIKGPEGHRQRITEVIAAFPDINFTIEDMVAEGDKVVARWTLRGTHLGEFIGIPPTGKQVAVSGVIIHRLAGGKIVEDWALRDSLGLMRQLGLIPPPGQAGK